MYILKLLKLHYVPRFNLPHMWLHAHKHTHIHNYSHCGFPVSIDFNYVNTVLYSLKIFPDINFGNLIYHVQCSIVCV